VPQLIRNWWWEGLCLLVYGALAGSQLFTVPITGLADNRDFAKVLEKVNICDPAKDQPPFVFVYPTYKINRACDWDGGVTSSELLLTQAIKNVALWNARDSFSIQAAGKAHFSLAMAAMAILLWSLRETRPLMRYSVPLLVILIFSDVAYVAYMNSFYTDAAALVFLLLTTSLAVAAVLRPQPWVTAAFAIASVLFITSKVQHAVLGPLVAVLAVWFGLKCRKQGRMRVAGVWMASAAGTLIAAGIMVNLTTVEYKSQALFNLIFFRLAPQSPEPVEVLQELGLPASYQRLVGTTAFSENTPTSDWNWDRKFLAQTSFTKLVGFYIRRPAIPVDLIWSSLRSDGSGIRPSNLSNYRAKDGFGPGTLARRFDSWSNLRSWLILVFPAHVVIFYGLAVSGSLACIIRPAMAERWPLYPVTLLLSAAGVVEFACATCLDCVENARHLFLFHVITELLIVCAFAAVWGYAWDLLRRDRLRTSRL